MNYQNNTIINCWFCSELCENRCFTAECHQFGVAYAFYVLNDKFKLFSAQMQINLNSKLYYVNYLLDHNVMEVVEKYSPPSASAYYVGDYYLKRVFSVPYTSLILTPQNIQTKLPTLLLFL